MNVLGVIPARGGSKGIPRKNLALAAGRPLLSYACEAAMGSQTLSRVVLSTDDHEIAQAGIAWGVEAPFLRPPGLSGDETPMLEVLQHAVQWLDDGQAWKADVVALLQPTSPLRESSHVDAAVRLLLETGADTVVSVTEVPHRFTPGSVMRVDSGGHLKPFLEGPMVLRRQDKPTLYARNGPAVLVVRYDVLMREGRLYGNDCRPLIMDPADSLDVDSPFDLELADCILARRLAEGQSQQAPRA